MWPIRNEARLHFMPLASSKRYLATRPSQVRRERKRIVGLMRAAFATPFSKTCFHTTKPCFLAILSAPIWILLGTLTSPGRKCFIHERRGNVENDSSLKQVTLAHDLLQRKHSPVTVQNRNAPSILLGVMMMDTDVAALSRRALRAAFDFDEIDLRFVICRPRQDVALEPDVVALDMPENMNYGKTQQWFMYAIKTMRSSIRVVLKMDLDSLFCLSDIRYKVMHAPKYAFYGKIVNHHRCGNGSYCPPVHCKDVKVFKGDCWYYMQGGLYGISSSLLRELKYLDTFRTIQTSRQHEDIFTGHWLNQTKVREAIAAVETPFLHTKQLIQFDPHTYEKYVGVYYSVLRRLNCTEQEDRVAKEKKMYAER